MSQPTNMQNIYTQITFLLWFLMSIVWFIGFFGNKKTTRLPNAVEQIIANILLVIAALLVFNQESSGFLSRSVTPSSSTYGMIGILVCAIAVTFAIWARVSLGRNWSGAVITLKADHKLIETGPYKFVRHPIYTGFFFAALGMALTIGTLSTYIGTLLFLIAFLIRMEKEEALMITQFPNEYPEFKKRSKKLIPFVW